MFSITRPATRDIESLLELASSLKLSYAPVGMARTGAPRFNLDVFRAAIGSGRGDFDVARRALDAWEMFRFGWCEIFPKNADAREGTNVVVVARHLGFWSMNSCRVVYRIDQRGPEEQYGFAYGTLTAHAERGEEIFSITFDSKSGEVAYLIRAVSQPAALLARVGYPLSRLVQARFRRASAAAVRDAVSSRAAARDLGGGPR